MSETIVDMQLYELLLYGGGMWLLGAFVGYHVGRAVSSWRASRLVKGALFELRRP